MKNKLLKRLFATATASALALTMAVSMPGMVKADAPDETSKTAYLTKDLAMSSLTTTPEALFTFDLTKDTSVAGMKENGPEISSKSIAYTTGEAGTIASEVRNVVKTVDLLSDAEFTEAGVYLYKVVENATTSNFTDTGLVSGDQIMYYSQAEYNMYVYVANKADGSGVYIENVIVEKVKDDNGTELETPEKIDPTEPGNEDEGNAFRFKNIFNVKGGSAVTPTKPDPEEIYPENPTLPEIEDPDYGSALRISEKTVGLYAELNKEFSFSLTITKAPTDLGDGTYTAMLVKGDRTRAMTPVTLTAGQAMNFTLANGDKLVVNKDEMVVGTKFAVVEAGEENYTASASVASNGMVHTVNGTIGNGVQVSETVIGALNNHAEVTNTFDDTSIPPTGIVMNNLPAILLIALAFAAAVAYIVSKKRRAI